MRTQLGQTFRRRAAALLTTVRNKFPIAHHQLPSPVAGEAKGEGKFHARHPHLNPLPPEEGEETASRGAPHCCPRRIYGLRLALAASAAVLFSPIALRANPYLAKPGEAPAAIRVATCAVSGGFVHLYTALDNGLFDKYGIKASNVFIRGSGVALAAMTSDEVQFLYCAADATIPGMATGIDVKLVASPLVGLPYVMLARKDIKRPEDLKGKTLGVTRPGDLSFRLSKAVLKKFNLSEEDVKIRPIGGSQSERYNAMLQGVVQALVITPPLDVRGKKDGFNVLYKLNELDVPFIYSSLHTNSKTLKERPQLVQRFVAAMAESLAFVDKNPEKAKAAMAKAMKVTDPEALQSAYNAYAKAIINRRMLVPPDAVAAAMEIAREQGTTLRRTAPELVDSAFAENLARSGFLKEIWGSDPPDGIRK